MDTVHSLLDLEKELDLSKSKEDTLKLMPSDPAVAGGGASDSDDSEVLYETSRM